MIDALEADVTLALAYDIDAIHDHGNALAADWQKRLPNNASPGGWRTAQKTHFDDDGVFDHIYAPGAK